MIEPSRAITLKKLQKQINDVVAAVYEIKKKGERVAIHIDEDDKYYFSPLSHYVILSAKGVWKIDNTMLSKK